MVGLEKRSRITRETFLLAAPSYVRRAIGIVTVPLVTTSYFAPRSGF